MDTHGSRAARMRALGKGSPTVRALERETPFDGRCGQLGLSRDELCIVLMAPLTFQSTPEPHDLSSETWPQPPIWTIRDESLCKICPETRTHAAKLPNLGWELRG
jgi:hypothetical protein